MKSTRRSLATRLHTGVLRMLDDRSEAGLETLEKLILGAVIIGAASAFALAFNGKFDSLLNAFKSAF
ncbi:MULTISPECIES: hypothetical protein [unclassified Streptomyces]|uniref:hypothetical protein n=1 Tax=unclassified Streptomyces TaxID=2593676 RepID=UPI000C275423|nr:hypothetical protein [Streptomyces sp. CB02959]PJN36587.1 hypothetical protein CG747_32105 [Streptomyces sp. CB02959]